MTRFTTTIFIMFLAVGCYSIPCSETNSTFVALTEKVLAKDAAAACANYSLELANVVSDDFRSAVNTTFWCASTHRIWIGSWNGDNYSLPAILLFTGADPSVGGSIVVSQTSNQSYQVLCKRTSEQIQQLIMGEPKGCMEMFINFDDIQDLALPDGEIDSEPFLTNGYSHMNWENIFSLSYKNLRAIVIEDSGYKNATISGQRVAANPADVSGYANPGIISHSISFALKSAQVGLAYGNNGYVVFVAYKNGSFVDTHLIHAFVGKSMLVEFPPIFHDVDKVMFMDVTSGFNVILDDVSICHATAAQAAGIKSQVPP